MTTTPDPEVIAKAASQLRLTEVPFQLAVARLLDESLPYAHLARPDSYPIAVAAQAVADAWFSLPT